MKAVFISNNQALTEKIEFLLDEMEIRGFTRWTRVQGRGSRDGEPHLGTHTWPALNDSILTIVPAAKVQDLLDKLRRLDANTKMQGLKAYVWNIEDAL